MYLLQIHWKEPKSEVQRGDSSMQLAKWGFGVGTSTELLRTKHICHLYSSKIDISVKGC